MSQKKILPFSKIDKNSTSLTGGKGSSLGEMINSKVPVSDGFVVLTNAFENYIKENNLNKKINSKLKNVKVQNISSIDKTSKEIRDLIEKGTLSKELEKEILNEYKKLDCKYVAVRSSATAEDSSDAAWAGQLDSFLNSSKVNLFENIKKCWSSLFTPRAISYRFEKKLDKKNISVAVVIQKMVQSEVSGIAFSVHPVTQDYNQMIIEGGYGLGEAIVSGQVTPDSYIVSKEPLEILEKNISNQEKKLVRSNSNLKWTKTKEPSKQKLKDKDILKLSKLILEIEKHYNFPCDIEWAYEKEKLYITQSRPITTLKPVKKEETKNWLDPSNYYKVGEYPNGIYPIMLYLKAEKKENYKKKLGYPFNSDLFVGLYDNHYRQKGKHEELTKRYSKNIKKSLVDWNSKCYDTIKKIENHIQKSEKINFSNLSDEELIKELNDFNNKIIEIFAFFFSCISLQEAVEKHIIKNKLKVDFQELRPLYRVSTERLNDDLVNPKNNLEELVKKWGWYKLYFLRGKFTTKKDLLEIQKEAKNTPKIKISKNKFIKDIQYLAWLKFERIDTVNKAFYFCWPLLKEASRRAKIKEDEIELVSPDEIINAIKGKKIPLNFKSRNKHRGYIKVFDEIRVLSEKESKQLSKKYDEHFIEKNKEIFQGIISCKGYEKGKAIVIKNREDIKKIKGGEILIASETIVEYEPYMKKVKAMIIEQSSLLCHSAIFSREFNIPTVIGIPNATKHFNTNDLVEVDANKGIVKKLKEENIVDEISETDWKIEWEGPFSFNETSMAPNIYFKGLKETFGKSLNKLYITYENGNAKGHISYKDNEEIGEYLFKKSKNLLTVKRWCKEFKDSADKLYKILGGETEEVIRKLLKYDKEFRIYGSYNSGTKILFDKLDRKKDKKVWNLIEKARKYSETFYIDLMKLYEENNKIIQKETKYSKSAIYMLRKDEVVAYAKDKKIPLEKELLKRHNSSQFYYKVNKLKNNQNKNSHVPNWVEEKILTQKEIKKLNSKEVINLEKEVLGGKVAYKGKVRGVCRVIKNFKTDSIKKGEILVTGMTDPTFIPIIQKASAIITDGGGQLCHAAIVAREFKKPCIIATKYATKILKDGDLVEVDANKGIVKKLKKENIHLKYINSEKNKFSLLNQDIDTSFLTLETTTRGLRSELIEKQCGKKAPKLYQEIIKGKTINSYANKKEFIKFSKICSKTLLEDKKLRKELITQTKKICDNISNFYLEEISHINKNSKENDIEILKKIDEMQVKIVEYGVLATFSDVTGEITNKCINIVDKRKNLNYPKYIYSNVLSTPDNKSLNEITREKIKNSEVIRKEFYWIDQGYIGRGLIKKQFNQIKKEKKLEEIKNKKELKKELKLNKKEIEIFDVAKLIIELKTLRIDHRQMLNVMVNKINDKYARKIKIKKEYLETLSIQELIETIKLNEIPNSLNKRYERSLILEKNNNYHFICNEEIEQFLNFITERKKFKDIKIIKGQIAQSGKIQGKVKLILGPQHNNKIKKGDILVTTSTSPQLLPAMRKSSAFITEVGGITSHAAIVARETKTPCIVGIENITSILKDGDLVEVNANKGIVKKLKQYK